MAGYLCDVANDGREGVEKHELGNYDLIFMDVVRFSQLCPPLSYTLPPSPYPTPVSLFPAGDASDERLRGNEGDTKEREGDGDSKRSGDHWPIRECKRRVLGNGSKCWHE